MKITACSDGFCTSDLQWCAVPYVKDSFIIIHQSQQVHLCRTMKTALSFIQEKENLCM